MNYDEEIHALKTKTALLEARIESLTNETALLYSSQEKRIDDMQGSKSIVVGVWAICITLIVALAEITITLFVK